MALDGFVTCAHHVILLVQLCAACRPASELYRLLPLLRPSSLSIPVCLASESGMAQKPRLLQPCFSTRNTIVLTSKVSNIVRQGYVRLLVSDARQTKDREAYTLHTVLEPSFPLPLRPSCLISQGRARGVTRSRPRIVCRYGR